MRPSMWDKIVALFLSDDTRGAVYLVLALAFVVGLIAGHFG